MYFQFHCFVSQEEEFVELVASLLNCWRRNLDTSEIVSIYKLLLMVTSFLSRNFMYHSQPRKTFN